jgi:hypothetical protein
MPSPFIGGRIPQELHEALQNHIAESGEKLPQILQRALANYLSYTPPISKSHTGLEERIASLEASFNSLKEKFEQMKRASPPVEIKEEGNSLPGQLSFLDGDNVPDNRIDIKEDTDIDTDIKSVIDADNSREDNSDNNTDIKSENTDNELDITTVINKERANKVPDNIFDINTDNNSVEDDNTADNEADIVKQELTHDQVAERIGKTLAAVRTSHGRKTTLEDEQYKYVPGGRRNHPRWLIEKR